MQNGYVESFNGKFGDECLNAIWFLNLADAKQNIERWRNEYNAKRPPQQSCLPDAEPVCG
jgi:putative transposase